MNTDKQKDVLSAFIGVYRRLNMLLYGNALVTAPWLALDTSLQYLAKTPVL
jgi:hypothetical protein